MILHVTLGPDHRAMTERQLLITQAIILNKLTAGGTVRILAVRPVSQKWQDGDIEASFANEHHPQ